MKRTKYKKYIKLFISTVLCISMLFGNSIGVFATGTISTPTSSPGTGGSGNYTDGVAGGIGIAGPAIILQVRHVTVTSDNEEARKSQLTATANSHVISGEGVYDGSSIGDYQFAILSDSHVTSSELEVYRINGSSYTQDTGVLSSFVMSLFNDTFGTSSFPDSNESYYSVLDALDPSLASEFMAYKNMLSYTCPILEWTVGFCETHGGQAEVYTPAVLTTDMSNWYTGFASYSDFVNHMYSSQCTKDISTHVWCRIWAGPHNGHTRAYVWAGANAWAGTNYAPIDGLNYYARGYWGPFNGDDIPLSSSYSFSTTGAPDDCISNIETGANQVSGFEVYITADDTTKARVKAMADAGSSKTFKVVITTSSGASYSQDPESESKGTFKQLGIPPWHDPTWSHFQSASRVIVTDYGSNNSGSTVTMTLTALDFYNLLEGTWWVNYVYLVDGKVGATSLRHTVKFKVTVTDDAGEHTATPSTYKADSRQEAVDGNTAATNFANWMAPGATHYDWEFHTTSSPDAYAEIVANCVGSKTGTVDGLAADWNVEQGIPSTENLSVAVGGQAFCIDLGGKVHGFGNAIANSAYVSNNADGVKNSQYGNAAITRNITFNVKITDIWGVDNTRCTLTCPGHSWSSSTSVTASATGAGSSDSKTCPWCGTTITVSGTTTPATYDDKGHELSPAVDNTVSSTHTCTVGLSFDCSTGTWVSSGDTGGLGTCTAVLTNNQNYQGSGEAKNKLGSVVVTGSVSNGLLCEGYTSGYGCVHSDGNLKNCAHHDEANYTFHIVETVDTYAYRELTTAKIYGLEKAQISEIDTSVVNLNLASVNKSSSNTNLTARVWRANGSYNGSNGRVWFTQFANPYYTAWTSTSVINSTDNTTSYWLGNCTINIKAYANNVIADDANPEAVDFLTKYVNSDQGKTDKRWTEDTTHGTTTYQAQLGDKLTALQRLNEALQVVNAWQAANKSSAYTVNIISDAVCVDVANVGSQNILSESYAIDNGISLFNYGFRSNGETYYRNHACKWGSQEAVIGAVMGNSLWDSYDSVENLYNAKTVIVGYCGVPGSDPDAKYGALGSYYHGTDQAFIGALGVSNMGGYVSNGERWSLGALNTGTNDCYTKLVGTGIGSPGVTVVKTQTEGSATSQAFSGYYTTFTYPNTGNFTVKHYVNNSVSGTGVSVTNSGTANLTSYQNADGSTISYKNAMVISNIPLKQSAENGKYTSPIKVQVTYTNMFEFQNSSTCNKCSTGPTLGGRATTYNAKYSNEYADGMLNDIIIHDPVSVEYWQIIGNGYGDYDGAGPAVDETNEDFRVLTRNTAETSKDNYVVIGNTFHVWVTDLGDFYDPLGSSNPITASLKLGVGCSSAGANVNTGVVNSNAKGYTDDMNTGRWVKERAILFEFPVGCYKANGEYVAIPANTWINLGALQCNTLTGKGSVSQASDGSYTNGTEGAFHAAPSALNSSNSPTWDEQFKYGLDYEFVMLTSTYESAGAGISYRTRAINEGSSLDCSQMVENNFNREGNYQADSCVYKRDAVEAVGRIGNLALEDVGDFRFSNLFKKAEENTWLIDGVIHRVDSNYPVKILTVDKDILGNVRTNGGNLQTRSHATLSVTNYVYGNVHNLGKAGYWDSLPLTAAKNDLTELNTEQMRLGYSAYFDIETIGNYYGITKDESGNCIDGVMSASDENNNVQDNRVNVMAITPHYYLYDYTNNKFYAIDLYSGSTGAYTKFYSSTDASNVVHTTDSSLYIDLPNEEGRRNVTALEKTYTARIVEYMGTERAAYLKSDYIGTAMKIVLDANDLDYIGSAYKYSDLTVNGYTNGSGNQLGTEDMFSGSLSSENNVMANDFIAQSQRWYFTLAVPSSTIPTYPGVDRTNQQDIIASYEKLKAEHPNAVIVAFADIMVQGTVYALQYDARTVNSGDVVISLYKNTAKPNNWQAGWYNNIVLAGDTLKVYNASGSHVDTISQEWAPLIVYDAYNTSSNDLDTYGTH